MYYKEQSQIVNVFEERRGKKKGNLIALKTKLHFQSSQNFQSQNIYFQNKTVKYDIQQQIRKDKDSIWAKVKCICGLYQAYVM